jgi:hypothetical protein
MGRREALEGVLRQPATSVAQDRKGRACTSDFAPCGSDEPQNGINPPNFPCSLEIAAAHGGDLVASTKFAGRQPEIGPLDTCQ